MKKIRFLTSSSFLYFRNLTHFVIEVFKMLKLCIKGVKVK